MVEHLGDAKPEYDNSVLHKHQIRYCLLSSIDTRAHASSTRGSQSVTHTNFILA